eukprot:2487302-Rhodomonas_salina.1
MASGQKGFCRWGAEGCGRVRKGRDSLTARKVGEGEGNGGERWETVEEGWRRVAKGGEVWRKAREQEGRVEEGGERVGEQWEKNGEGCGEVGKGGE